MRRGLSSMRLAVVSESVVKQVVSWPLVMSAVREAFESAADGGLVFPVAFGVGSAGGDWGVKSGLVPGASPQLGLKVGSYFPQNRSKGLAAHGSTTLLLDDATGFPKALINAHFLNGMRTAAATNAISITSPRFRYPIPKRPGCCGGCRRPGSGTY